MGGAVVAALAVVLVVARTVVLVVAREVVVVAAVEAVLWEAGTVFTVVTGPGDVVTGGFAVVAELSPAVEVGVVGDTVELDVPVAAVGGDGAADVVEPTGRVVCVTRRYRRQDRCTFRVLRSGASAELLMRWSPRADASATLVTLSPEKLEKPATPVRTTATATKTAKKL